MQSKRILWPLAGKGRLPRSDSGRGWCLGLAGSLGQAGKQPVEKRAAGLHDAVACLCGLLGRQGGDKGQAGGAGGLFAGVEA